MPTPTKPTAPPKKGFPVIFIAITLVILLAGGYFVFEYTKGASNPLSQLVTNSMTPKINEDMFKDIDDPLIRKHYAAQFSQTTFEIKSTSSGMGEDMENTTTYIVGEPYKIRMTTKQSGKLVSDSIDIGDTTYVLDVKTNTWYKQTVTSKPDEKTNSDLKDIVPPKTTEEAQELVSKSTFKKLGEEACGGLTCYKYEEQNSDNPEGKRIIWFDTKKYLLRKEENAFGEFKSIMTYAYDGVTVVAPSNAKEVPEGKSIYDYVSSTSDVPDEYKKYMKDAEKLGSEMTVPSSNAEDMTVEGNYGEENY